LDRKDLIRKFVFDVDGTLTPSRKRIDEEFGNFFLDFTKNNLVYFVTGSDKPKTVEQLGEEIFNSSQLSFNCAGNEVWNKDYLVHSSDWKPDETVIEYLEELLDASDFELRAGNHIELRKGMVNFSIVGRKCTNEERELYKEWDSRTKERSEILEKIRKQFSHIDVYIGGETGLDIFEKGRGKSQSISKIRTSPIDEIYYYGDQIFPGGNDYDVANLCNHAIDVNDWVDTYHSLMTISELIR
jgi:phosphomannomutase